SNGKLPSTALNGRCTWPVMNGRVPASKVPSAPRATRSATHDPQPTTHYPLPITQHLLRRQHQEHEVGGSTAHHVLHLLPEVGEFLEFGEVRSDQRGAGNHAARDVRVISPVQAV